MKKILLVLLILTTKAYSQVEIPSEVGRYYLEKKQELSQCGEEKKLLLTTIDSTKQVIYLQNAKINNYKLETREWKVIHTADSSTIVGKTNEIKGLKKDVNKWKGRTFLATAIAAAAIVLSFL